MGCLLELVSALPPTSTVLTPLRKETRVRQDASHRSLQPTCCQRAPLKPTNSRARDSHLADHLFQPRPSLNTLVLSSDRHRRRGHRIARRHLRSRVMQQLAPLHQSWSFTVLTCPTWGGATPVFLGGCQSTRWASHLPRGPNDVTIRTPCRAAPDESRLHETVRCRAEDPFRSHPPRCLLSGSGVPSTDRSLPPRPCWR